MLRFLRRGEHYCPRDGRGPDHQAKHCLGGRSITHIHTIGDSYTVRLSGITFAINLTSHTSIAYRKQRSPQQTVSTSGSVRQPFEGHCMTSTYLPTMHKNPTERPPVGLEPGT